MTLTERVSELVDHQCAMTLRFHWLRQTRYGSTLCAAGAGLMAVLEGLHWRFWSLMAGWALIMAARQWLHSDIDRRQHAFIDRLYREADEFPEPYRSEALAEMRARDTREDDT